MFPAGVCFLGRPHSVPIIRLYCVGNGKSSTVVPGAQCLWSGPAADFLASGRKLSKKNRLVGREDNEQEEW